MNVTIHGERNPNAKGFGVSNVSMQENAIIFLENMKSDLPTKLTKAVLESVGEKKRAKRTADETSFLPDDDDDEDNDEDVIFLGKVDDEGKVMDEDYEEEDEDEVVDEDEDEEQDEEDQDQDHQDE